MDGNYLLLSETHGSLELLKSKLENVGKAARNALNVGSAQYGAGMLNSGYRIACQ